MMTTPLTLNASTLLVAFGTLFALFSDIFIFHCAIFVNEQILAISGKMDPPYV